MQPFVTILQEPYHQFAKRTGRVIVERRCITDGVCPICLERFDTLPWSRHLPCGHTYHSRCLRQQQQSAATSHNTCAICRAPIPASYRVPTTSNRGDNRAVLVQDNMQPQHWHTSFTAMRLKISKYLAYLFTPRRADSI